jgi:hypothetical protein
MIFKNQTYKYIRSWNIGHYPKSGASKSPQDGGFFFYSWDSSKRSFVNRILLYANFPKHLYI